MKPSKTSNSAKHDLMKKMFKSGSLKVMQHRKSLHHVTSYDSTK